MHILGLFIPLQLIKFSITQTPNDGGKVKI